jgi:hypothetical protein
MQEEDGIHPLPERYQLRQVLSLLAMCEGEHQ